MSIEPKGLSESKRFKIRDCLLNIDMDYYRDYGSGYYGDIEYLSKYVAHQMDIDGKEREYNLKEGRYDFIPNPTETIRRFVYLATRFLNPMDRNLKFLDCGSGLGFTLYLATTHRFKEENIAGIEINKKYVDVSKTMFPRLMVFNEDIFNFKNYEDYDVIYFYHPFSKIDLQRKFEDKIIKECKSGGIVLGNFNGESQMGYSDDFCTYSNDFHYKWI